MTSTHALTKVTTLSDDDVLRVALDPANSSVAETDRGVTIETLLAQSRTATTTTLEDISDSINTSALKVEGSRYFNTTTNVPVWAVGNADSDVWVNALGSTTHTPTSA